MRDNGSIHDGYLFSRDGFALYFRERRMPDARAQILLVHGVAEHYGRYRSFEAFFAGHGIGFSMMDLRGHGQSEGRRVFVPSFEAYLDDLDVLVGHVETHAQNVFLVGHSLGGVIAIRYAQTRKPRFRGLVTSGAALRSSITPPRRSSRRSSWSTSSVRRRRCLGSLSPSKCVATRRSCVATNPTRW